MNEEVREALEKYPYLKKYNFLFVSQKEFEAFKHGEIIRVDDLTYSKELLSRLLSDDLYYSYVENLYKRKSGEFLLTFPIFGDTGETIRYSRKDLLFGLDEYVETCDVSDKERTRFEMLKKEMTFDSMKQKYASYIYPIKIDGKFYRITGEDIISLLDLDVDEFDELCFKPDIKDYRGIPKEHFIYAVKSFIKQSKIFEEYVLPEEVMDRIDDVLSNQIIDLEVINFSGDKIDEGYENLQVDPKLREKILEGMDPDFTTLEKAMYIYIMMCKTLTYDEEYYAAGQKGPVTLKHKEKEYIEEINLDHNEVVCFEFDLIYSKLLHELGLDFHLDNKSLDSEYGEAHADLTFRCGKYLVFADSVTSILKGDMYNAKMGKKLAGLRCLNKNITTKEEFEESLDTVYSYIKDREHKRRPLDEVVSEYRESTDSIIPISFEDRLELMLEKVRSADLSTIDDYSYIMDLRKVMFSKLEQDNNIAFIILRDTNPKDEDKEIIATALFVVNEKSFYDKNSENKYFIYRPHEDLKNVSGIELLDMLAFGKLEYIREDDSDRITIPGITGRRV